MDSSNIDKIIENSVDRAKEMNHEYCTLEHVTLSLLEHKKIVDLLSSLQIETDKIKSDLDMYNFGNSKEVKDFIKQDFEILIDFSRECINPIKHVVASSKSGLKIGRHSEESEKYFDFMVDMDKTAPISQFIKQVNTFLKNPLKKSCNLSLSKQ